MLKGSTHAPALGMSLTHPRRAPAASGVWKNRYVRRALAGAGFASALAVLGCSETRNLGTTTPHGLLPVDERNPIVLQNDGVYDNWQGEYAILFSSRGGPKLAGIIVNTSPPQPDIDVNMAGWTGLVGAAHAAGLLDIPDPTKSVGPQLVRPASGQLDATKPNGSPGALLILDAAARLSLPYRPLVIVTGGRLTDVADAYLMDPTVTDRVVIVSALGTATDTGAIMAAPNGEMDPWADAIVTQRFRFVQVSAYYDQLGDVPAVRIADLPNNPLGAWIAAKQPKIWDLPHAADQVAVMAVGVPSFAVTVPRVSPRPPGAANATAGPDLVTDPNGKGWLVTESASAGGTERFWNVLQDPATFQP